MATRPPSIERLRTLFCADPDTGVVRRAIDVGNGLKAGMLAGSRPHHSGYLRVWIDGREYPLHRIAFALYHSRWPAGVVDHIDGDRANNRQANLREATNTENVRNQRRSSANRSGYKGVSWRSSVSRFRAAICVNRKMRHIGYFDDPEVAARAYDAEARKEFGEFARLNFKDSA